MAAATSSTSTSPVEVGYNHDDLLAQAWHVVFTVQGTIPASTPVSKKNIESFWRKILFHDGVYNAVKLGVFKDWLIEAGLTNFQGVYYSVDVKELSREKIVALFGQVKDTILNKIFPQKLYPRGYTDYLKGIIKELTSNDKLFSNIIQVGIETKPIVSLQVLKDEYEEWINMIWTLIYYHVLYLLKGHGSDVSRYVNDDFMTKKVTINGVDIQMANKNSFQLIIDDLRKLGTNDNATIADQISAFIFPPPKTTFQAIERPNGFPVARDFKLPPPPPPVKPQTGPSPPPPGPSPPPPLPAGTVPLPPPKDGEKGDKGDKGPEGPQGRPGRPPFLPLMPLPRMKRTLKLTGLVPFFSSPSSLPPPSPPLTLEEEEREEKELLRKVCNQTWPHEHLWCKGEGNDFYARDARVFLDWWGEKPSNIAAPYHLEGVFKEIKRLKGDTTNRVMPCPLGSMPDLMWFLIKQCTNKKAINWWEEEKKKATPVGAATGVAASSSSSAAAAGGGGGGTTTQTMEFEGEEEGEVDATTYESLQKIRGQYLQLQSAFTEKEMLYHYEKGTLKDITGVITGRSITINNIITWFNSTNVNAIVKEFMTPMKFNIELMREEIDILQKDATRPAPSPPVGSTTPRKSPPGRPPPSPPRRNTSTAAPSPGLPAATQPGVGGGDTSDKQMEIEKVLQQFDDNTKQLLDWVRSADIEKNIKILDEAGDMVKNNKKVLEEAVDTGMGDVGVQQAAAQASWTGLKNVIDKVMVSADFITPLLYNAYTFMTNFRQLYTDLSKEMSGSIGVVTTTSWGTWNDDILDRYNDLVLKTKSIEDDITKLANAVIRAKEKIATTIDEVLKEAQDNKKKGLGIKQATNDAPPSQGGLFDGLGGFGKVLALLGTVTAAMVIGGGASSGFMGGVSSLGATSVNQQGGQNTTTNNSFNNDTLIGETEGPVIDETLTVRGTSNNGTKFTGVSPQAKSANEPKRLVDTSHLLAAIRARGGEEEGGGGNNGDAKNEKPGDQFDLLGGAMGLLRGFG
jgi:hypothetical protein